MSETTAVTGSPRKNVPFLLPRSSSDAPVAEIEMRACRRDTVGESSLMLPSSDSRPRMFSPERSGSRLPSLINQQNVAALLDSSEKLADQVLALPEWLPLRFWLRDSSTV